MPETFISQEALHLPLFVLNATILALLDIRKATNARAMIRTFTAFPHQALDLLIKPL